MYISSHSLLHEAPVEFRCILFPLIILETFSSVMVSICAKFS